MKVSFEKTLELLSAEDVVAVPTETVYGLAARYDSEKAIRLVYEIKNRPLDHPLILHIASQNWLDELADHLQPYISKLIDAFWPGPLTLVLKKKNCVSNLITADQDTVAIRMPDHPDLLKLIKKLGMPLVAPSANVFCKTSPTNADHVEDNFKSAIAVLDGGPCKVGIESTIVLATENSSLTILRPGIISAEEIEAVAGVACYTNDDSLLKVSGKKQVHYRPEIPVFFFEKTNFKGFSHEKEITKRYVVMYITPEIVENFFYCATIQMPAFPIQYAQLLYDQWSCISSKVFDGIIVELPPDKGAWAGIRDRILKAAMPLNF